MPTTSPIQALPLPVPGDQPLIPADMTALAQAVEKRLIMRFATTSERDSKITAPENGMFAWLTTNKILTVHDGTTWVNFFGLIPAFTVTAVDSVNSGGRFTLKGAGTNKDWLVAVATGALSFTHDTGGVNKLVASMEAAAFSLGAGVIFKQEGVNQPVLRSGSAAPNNAVGRDGDWYARWA